jgi:hypothetical protein
MNTIISFMDDVQKRKFKTSIGRRYFTDEQKIESDQRYDEVKKWIEDKYVKEGMGIKSMISDYKLPITYSVFRNILRFFDVRMRENNEVTDFLRARRKKNAKAQRNEMTGFSSLESIEKSKNKTTTSRGIQGYYWNESRKKWVWLRSSWEYIYAKWLDEKGMNWDVEVKTYKITDHLVYRPDFFIYNDQMDLETVVEVKGYWKDKVWKVDELKRILEPHNIKICVITDVTPYTKSIKRDTRIWKTARQFEQK